MRTTTITCSACGRQNRVPAAAEGRPRCGHCSSPLPWLVDAGDEDFTEVAEKATPFVLVDMWAPWCSPCRTISPALERVAREMAGHLKLVKVEVDTNPQLAERFQIKAVPTLLILDAGRVIARQAGAVPVGALRSWVEQATAGRKQQTTTGG